MPKIVSYTPAWLSKPASGHKLFAPAPDTTNDYPALPNGARKKASPQGAKRTIAHRGTEVFVAVGKEIRWADLLHIKERWAEKEEQKYKGKSRDDDYDDDFPYDQGFRVSSSAMKLFRCTTI